MTQITWSYPSARLDGLCQCNECGAMVYETAQRLHQSWHLDSQRRASAAAWVEGYEHAEDFAEPDEKPFSVWDNPYIKPGENPDGSVR